MATVGDKRRATEIDRSVGRRMRQARKLKNVTLEDLAEALNISYQQVQKYEKGTNRISSAMLFDIAQILGQPITYFYGEYIADPNVEERDSISPGYQACLQQLQQFEQAESFEFIEAFLEAALMREASRR